MIGLGLLASYLAALGISVALWQHLLGRELHASAPLVSFAVLAACGVPYLVAALLATEAQSAARCRFGSPLHRSWRSVPHSAAVWCWCRGFRQRSGSDRHRAADRAGRADRGGARVRSGRDPRPDYATHRRGVVRDEQLIRQVAVRDRLAHRGIRR